MLSRSFLGLSRHREGLGPGLGGAGALLLAEPAVQGGQPREDLRLDARLVEALGRIEGGVIRGLGLRRASARLDWRRGVR